MFQRSSGQLQVDDHCLPVTLHAGMARPVVRFFIGFAVAAGLLAAVILFGLSRPGPPPLPLPNPNGYDDLVKAAELLAGDVSDWQKLSGTNLATIVAQNVEALKLA